MIDRKLINDMIEKMKSKTTDYPDAIPIKKHMMSQVSRERLWNLADLCIKYTNRSNTSMVECGIANGGCVALMKHLSNGKPVWGFDSFSPMPALTKEDKQDMTEEQKKNNPQKYVGMIMGTEENVKHTFSVLDIPMDNVKIIKGLFQDTLPSYKEEVGKISILRIDCDWYEATKFCLRELYNSVVDGGVIIIDDYGCFSGCQKAVDEFRSSMGIDSPLFKSDYTERFWFKRENLEI
jgi:hypothetical protein